MIELMMVMTVMTRDDTIFYLASELANPTHTGLLHDRSWSDLTSYLIQPLHVFLQTTACLYLLPSPSLSRPKYFVSPLVA